MALADVKVQQEEITKPKKIVQKEWVSLKDNIDSFKKRFDISNWNCFWLANRKKGDSKHLIADFKQFQKRIQKLIYKKNNWTDSINRKSNSGFLFWKKYEQLLMNEYWLL